MGQVDVFRMALAHVINVTWAIDCVIEYLGFKFTPVKKYALSLDVKTRLS